MGKIVGKLFIICLFFFKSLHAQVKLRALDTAGNILQQACVGEPFTLEVEITNTSNAMQTPIIAGLDRFVAKRSSLYMHTINGKSVIRYSYQIHINQVGTYEIGPAKITDHSQTQSSNILTITVSDKTTKSHQAPLKKVSQYDEKESLRLFVDNNKVVIGQKIRCTLRFYYQNNTIELRQIGKPKLDNFTIKNIQDPHKGVESINGSNHKYVEWNWDLYPLQTGENIIPAYRVDFDVLSKRSHTLRGFSVLFGPNNERKHVYANAVHIQVDPLPPYDGLVQAVGSFKKIEAHIKPAVVKKGEGMVLAIELEGDGDLKAIETPILDNLPKQLKYYESSNSIIEPINTTTLPKKRFEFIVQGIESGEWEIPQQSFTYFDIDDHSYKTLYTMPLAVSIVPTVSNPTIINHAKQAAEKKQNDKQNVDTIYPITHKGAWYPIRDRKPINWYLFCFLSGIPFFLWLYQTLWRRYSFFGNYQFLWWQKKNAFRVARRDLEKAIATQNIAQVYYIFVTLLSVWLDRPIIDFSVIVLEQQLRKAGLSKNSIALWNTFFMQATEYAFTIDKKDKVLTSSFLKEGKQWINTFERIW